VGALSILTSLLAAVGMLQAVFGYALVRRFARRTARPPVRHRPVTVLKPLHGDEPRLEEALGSLLCQAGGLVQVVLGVQDPGDPALRSVERARRRFPAADVAVVVDPTPHGRNRKVANLINMLPAARHDVLVIADSDVHAPPGYIAALVAALDRPGVGLATTLYTGLPASDSVAARLGATALTHGILPGALMARAMGRRDCLGATMALRRETLERIGGLASLSPHLADDNVLGQLVRAQGLDVVLAATVPATTVGESQLRDLYQHELRWARTIGGIVPIRFALSTIQYPLAWGLFSVALSGGEQAAVAVFLAAWVARALVTRGIDRMLALGRPGAAAAALASPAPIWLLPLRDLLSLTVAVASYLGDEVIWRGHVMHSGGAGRARLARRELGTEPP
jgi:ceramide glucosyltransferase